MCSLTYIKLLTRCQNVCIISVMTRCQNKQKGNEYYAKGITGTDSSKKRRNHQRL